MSTRTNTDIDGENEEKKVVHETPGSPELGRKLSRTIAAREDARKLKTATLDRMGKLFKINSNRATNISNEPVIPSCFILFLNVLSFLYRFK